MTNDQEIGKLEERKRQIDVEIAFKKGESISIKHKGWHFYEKYDGSHPKFEWDSFDYIVTPEPKQIPFDGSDAERLIGRKFKRIDDWDVKYRIAIDTLDHGVQFFNEFVSYENLKNDYLIWNDLLDKFGPCTKVG